MSESKRKGYRVYTYIWTYVYSVKGSGFSVKSSGFSVKGLWLRIKGSGFSVQGLAFRVQGLALGLLLLTTGGFEGQKRLPGWMVGRLERPRKAVTRCRRI